MHHVQTQSRIVGFTMNPHILLVSAFVFAVIDPLPGAAEPRHWFSLLVSVVLGEFIAVSHCWRPAPTPTSGERMG